MTLLIALAFVLILLSLFAALFMILRGPDKPGRPVAALSWRIGLSITLFALILLAWGLGYLQPHGVPY